MVLPHALSPTSETAVRRRATPARAAFVGVVAALACAPLLAPGAVADDHGLKHKQKVVHAGVKHAKADLDESSSALRASQAKLSAAKTRLVAAQRKLASTQTALNAATLVDRQMQAKLESARADLAAAQADVAHTRTAIGEQRAAIGRTAAASYSYGDPQLMGLSAMLEAQTPTEITSQLSTVDSLVSQQSAALKELQAQKALLVVQEKKVADTEAKVAQQRQEAADHLATVEALQKQAAADTAAVATTVHERAAAAAAAKKVRAHDVATLKRLQKQEARIKRQILARAQHETNQTVADTGGLLMRPVPGYITSPYGWRLHPIYHYWGLHDGDDFHAPCGTPERAARGGKVVSEYYSSVWGNRLYLDLGNINGSNFTVIYNHIERYAAHTGEHVKRGQVVAYAGTTGWSTGCHLHFTVMKNGVAVNPMNYIG